MTPRSTCRRPRDRQQGRGLAELSRLGPSVVRPQQVQRKTGHRPDCPKFFFSADRSSRRGADDKAPRSFRRKYLSHMTSTSPRLDVTCLSMARNSDRSRCCADDHQYLPARAVPVLFRRSRSGGSTIPRPMKGKGPGPASRPMRLHLEGQGCEQKVSSSDPTNPLQIGLRRARGSYDIGIDVAVGPLYNALLEQLARTRDPLR